MESKEINIPDGESFIDINLSIPAGNDLEIGFAEGANLFRNNANTNYPYQVNNVISIKASTANIDPLDYYYYLYDWQITTLGGCETTDRSLVTITVSEKPEVPSLSLDPETNIINVNEDFYSYQWYLNNEIIIDATDNNLLINEIGSYTVEVSNNNGCSTISEKIELDSSTLSVNTNTLTYSAINIYPVPTQNILYIDGLTNLEQQINNIKIVNTLGQTVKTYNNAITSINTSSFANGLYFLIINNELSKKFLKN